MFWFKLCLSPSPIKPAERGQLGLELILILRLLPYLQVIVENKLHEIKYVSVKELGSSRTLHYYSFMFTDSSE